MLVYIQKKVPVLKDAGSARDRRSRYPRVEEDFGLFIGWPVEGREEHVRFRRLDISACRVIGHAPIQYRYRPAKVEQL